MQNSTHPISGSNIEHIRGLLDHNSPISPFGLSANQITAREFCARLDKIKNSVHEPLVRDIIRNHIQQIHKNDYSLAIEMSKELTYCHEKLVGNLNEWVSKIAH